MNGWKSGANEKKTTQTGNHSIAAFLANETCSGSFCRHQTSIEIFSKQRCVPGTCGLFTLERGVIM